MSATIFNRDEAARYLRTRWHLRVTAASLATMATRGGGPIFFKQGRYAYYTAVHLDEWASSRISGFLDSTSTPQSSGGGLPFNASEDFGDLPDEFDHYNTGNPHFDEITKLLEQAGISA